MGVFRGRVQRKRERQTETETDIQLILVRNKAKKKSFIPLLLMQNRNPVVVTISSLVRIWGECSVIHSPPALFFFFFFGSGD